MASEPAQWIMVAIVIMGFLFTDRNQRVEVEARFESRMDRMESRLARRIDGVRSQMGEMLDRMDRIEGTLGVLRELSMGSGRDTVA